MQSADKNLEQPQVNSEGHHLVNTPNKLTCRKLPQATQSKDVEFSVCGCTDWFSDEISGLLFREVTRKKKKKKI